MNWLYEILDWSEVWAPLLPLAIYYMKKPKAPWVKPILLFLIIAFILGLFIDVPWKANHFGIDAWCKKMLYWLYRGKEKTFYNMVFYNLGSLTRLLTFNWFFQKVIPQHRKLYIITMLSFVILFVVNFVFSENIMLDFSSRQHTLEAAILLAFCLLYFYRVNLDDEIESPIALPYSWVVTGLTLYTAVNFLIFLFYSYLINAESNYAINIWNVHNFSFILLNSFIAVSFWKAK